MIKIGLIGFGYWGPNLLRNLLGNNHFQVVAVADKKQERLTAVTSVDFRIRVTTCAEDLINDPDIQALVIATPVETHFSLALQALKNQKHVLIEKPMCASVEECKELIAVAETASLTLMIDHTFIFNPAVQKIHQICKSGELGKICSFDSIRVNLGLFQRDINVLWDLGPHDFSIINYLFNEHPVHIEAAGYAHLNSHLPDVVYLTMYFPSHVVAHFNMSWMSPVKMRRFSIGGTSKMLIWDDLNHEEKIKIYNNGISYQQEEKRNVIIPDYRIGDIFSPRVPNQEALQNVVKHFAQVIMNKEKSLMDGKEGLRIVSMLESAQKALDKNSLEVDKKRKEIQCHNMLKIVEVVSL
jgi:predicted dehydrogenase